MFNKNMGAINKKLWDLKYNKKINSTNILKMNSFKIKKIFEDEDMEDTKNYLRTVANKWCVENKINDYSYYIKIKKIVRKCSFNLTPSEEHNVNIIEEQTFSNFRHIKLLDANIDTRKKEFIYLKFIKSQLYISQDDNQLEEIHNGVLLISNQRIIITNKDGTIIIVAFSLRKIKDINFANYGLCFSNDDKNYVLRIHDQITLNNTFVNFVSKKVRWLWKDIKKKIK